MQKRIKILGVVMVGLLVAGTVYLGGIMMGSHQSSDMLVAQQETISAQRATLTEQEEKLTEQQEKLDQFDRERRGLDENGVRIDRMAIYYEESDGNSTANARFHTDAEFKRYCQNRRSEAVYPTNEWTADEVILSYRDQPEIWAYWDDRYQMTGFYYTWTPDYEHCFILDVGYSVERESYEDLNGGWLVVDGVRVKAFGQEIGPVEPMTLLADYQSSAWDGSSRMSLDLGTTAYIDSDGRLTYHYSAYLYDATVDPEGWAYTGYEEPWWVAEDLDPEIAALLEDAYYRPSEGLNRGRDFVYGSVDVNLYVDLPTSGSLTGSDGSAAGSDGSVTGSDGLLASYDRGEFFETCRFWKEGVTFGLAPTGVVLAQKGEILTEWELEVDPKDYQLLQPSEKRAQEHPEELVYLRVGDELWALRKDGTVELVLEIIQRNASNPDRIWGRQGDKLICWEGATYYRVSDGPYLVAEGVLETDFSAGVNLVRKADGCYVAAWNSSAREYTLEYLGAGALEDYKQLSEVLYEARFRR